MFQAFTGLMFERRLAQWPGSYCCWRESALPTPSPSTPSALVFSQSEKHAKVSLRWFGKLSLQIQRSLFYSVFSLKLRLPPSVYRRVETADDPPTAPLRRCKVAEFRPGSSRSTGPWRASRVHLTGRQPPHTKFPYWSYMTPCEQAADISPPHPRKGNTQPPPDHPWREN